jgi:hypothetical protein
MLKTLKSSASILLPIVPSIEGILTGFLRLISQKTYINLTTNSKSLQLEVLGSISIYRGSSTRYQYVSAIAHQLAAKFKLSPLEICQRFHTEFITGGAQYSPTLEMYLWYTDTGYLYFQLTPQGILTWLDYIYLCHLPLAAHPQLDPTQPVSALSLYAHARCCSRLKLVRTQRSIVARGYDLLLDRLDDRSGDDTQMISTLKWFDLDSKHRHNHCLGELGSDDDLVVQYRLIHALMDVLDGICGSRSPNYAKLTIDLAQSWLEFDRYCPIIGDLQSQNPQLAIARCGLTAISQRYLRILLEDYLGIVAPTEF